MCDNACIDSGWSLLRRSVQGLNGARRKMIYNYKWIYPIDFFNCKSCI